MYLLRSFSGKPDCCTFKCLLQLLYQCRITLLIQRQKILVALLQQQDRFQFIRLALAAISS
jgi:hypothetical protein